MEERQDHATRTISIVMIIALVGKVLGAVPGPSAGGLLRDGDGG